MLCTRRKEITASGIAGIIESVVSGSETGPDQSVAVSAVVGHADNFIFVDLTISIAAFLAGDSIRDAVPSPVNRPIALRPSAFRSRAERSRAKHLLMKRFVWVDPIRYAAGTTAILPLPRPSAR